MILGENENVGLNLDGCTFFSLKNDKSLTNMYIKTNSIISLSLNHLISYSNVFALTYNLFTFV